LGTTKEKKSQAEQVRRGRGGEEDAHNLNRGRGSFLKAYWGGHPLRRERGERKGEGGMQSAY